MPPSAVEAAWKGSYRMEVWMTGNTASSLLFLPDPDFLVVGERNGTVRVLDEQTRGPTSVVNAHGGSSVVGLVAMRSDHDDIIFASMAADGAINLWQQARSVSFLRMTSIL